jgi:hypothetical protein
MLNPFPGGYARESRRSMCARGQSLPRGEEVETAGCCALVFVVQANGEVEGVGLKRFPERVQRPREETKLF